MKIKRKIRWKSSEDLSNYDDLDKLSDWLFKFYSKNNHYYDSIDFTSKYWESNPLYKEIIRIANNSKSICEIGCGSSNILSVNSSIEDRYTGMDFSNELIESNKIKYQKAQFFTIKQLNKSPEFIEKFDLVFSTFVLEHVVRPKSFLEDSLRMVKSGGKLVLLCPDYMHKYRFPSQRVGLSSGGILNKIIQARFLDAALTFYDAHIKIPRMCRKLIKSNNIHDGFYINTAPIILEDGFVFPDSDAVYLTDKTEILRVFKKYGQVLKLSESLNKAAENLRWLFYIVKKE